MKVSRRTIIAGASALALTTRLPAQARRTRPVRKSVSTAGGQVDLLKYAAAVKLMMALPASDPRSWTYQWYIHDVPTNRSKQSEIQRLFASDPPGAGLALQTWSTCQGHHSGNDESDFLPWHRMYLMCFETTIRSLLNDPGFALPYWNYVDPAQRALPPSFLRPADPNFGVLYRAARRSAVNAGAAIDADLPGQMAIDGSALAQRTYLPSGPRSGFCQELDSKLHGNVHVRVGNSVGMGAVPWAANDPIFWLHHANIDRLWASWNANGGLNPQGAWLGHSFVFPNGTGGRAVMKNGAVSRLELAGYNYDHLEPGPAIVAGTAGGPPPPAQVLDAVQAPITIPPSGARVPLRPVRGRPRVLGTAGTRIFLVLSGLSAPTAPGVLYQVDLRGADGTWVTVGYINFFDAVAMADKRTGPDYQRRFSFDVTDVVSSVSGTPQVRIVPAGSPENAVSVSVGRVELVQG